MYILDPTQQSDHCQSPLHIQTDTELLPPRNTSLLHYKTTGHQPLMVDHFIITTTDIYA